jgi:hypothetical protein
VSRTAEAFRLFSGRSGCYNTVKGSQQEGFPVDRKSFFAALTGFVVCAGLGFAGRTAPIPETERDAREKLEALKKRLPKLIETFRAKAGTEDSYTPDVPVFRRLGPTEAKLTIAFRFRYSNTGQADPDYDELLTIFLRFYDGAWITTGMQASWPPVGNGWAAHPTRVAHYLMQDIDKVAR